MSLHDYLDRGPHGSTSSEAEQANLVHSVQRLSHEDRDSGFHELVDDPATFELLPSKSPLSSPELLHAVTALSSPAGPRDVSASFAGGRESDASTVSVSNASSTSSGVAQPDISAIEGVGLEKESVLFSPGSPSPAGSEEDVSGKGQCYLVRCSAECNINSEYCTLCSMHCDVFTRSTSLAYLAVRCKLAYIFRN